MNVLEIKDSPINVTLKNQYDVTQYPEDGIYRLAGNVNELIVITNGVYISLFTLVDKSWDEFIIAFDSVGTVSQDNDFILKAIAVSQKPELAFR